jgi:hypothetical protein
MNAATTHRLLINPETGQVAAPQLQRWVGGDAATARRFPPASWLTSVTLEMGVFSVTDRQLPVLASRAARATATHDVRLGSTTGRSTSRKTVAV